MARIDDISARAATRIRRARHHGQRISGSWFDGMKEIVSEYVELVADTVEGGSVSDLVRGGIALSFEATATAGDAYHQIYDACVAVTKPVPIPAPLTAEVYFEIDTEATAADPTVLGSVQIADQPDLQSTDLQDAAGVPRILSAHVPITIVDDTVCVSLFDLPDLALGVYQGAIRRVSTGALVAPVTVVVVAPVDPP